VSINQQNPYSHQQENKSAKIIEEIRMGYYIEYLNTKIPLYSGNLAHFSDSTHFYLIMKKYKSIDELENCLKKTSSLIDIAISLISQLYVLTKNLSTVSLCHGDEKFDNLLFEDTRHIANNFEFNINGRIYKSQTIRDNLESPEYIIGYINVRCNIKGCIMYIDMDIIYSKNNFFNN
jgi:thiamine kinase-like enzyme